MLESGGKSSELVTTKVTMAPTSISTPGTPSKISNERIFEMFSKIDGNQTALEQKFNSLEENIQQQISLWKVDIEKSLAMQTADFDEKINQLADDLEPRVSELEISKENYERNARLNDIILRGIPFIANEKLPCIFEALAVAIKFNYADLRSVVNSLYRLGKAGPILVKFTTSAFKVDFINKYIVKKHLILSDIGFNDLSSRIYISDNLTKHSEHIFKQAYQLKKDGILSEVVVRHGYVYIKIAGHSNRLKIINVNKLNEITSGQNL